ncbi:uncharacterized protein LOC143343490 [Colletes latitarsis]|uniref:uncharacterized protein LOC143343490 n=1 Tax=Colletes latitarsis TaxID=2605962 RepID=UPI0040367051
MELRSMSRRPPPPYPEIDSSKNLNSQDDSTSKEQNGSFSKFGDSCVDTMQKLRWQILDWSSCVNCGSRGSRCLYTLEDLKPDESNVIRAMHVASNTRTVETIKIIFEEVNKTCVATGESVSNEWFRIFDYGINYCNLRNLVTGIGYDKSPRFLELTTNAVCTQYNMAVCG